MLFARSEGYPPLAQTFRTKMHDKHGSPGNDVAPSRKDVSHPGHSRAGFPEPVPMIRPDVTATLYYKSRRVWHPEPPTRYRRLRTYRQTICRFVQFVGLCCWVV